MSRAHEANIGAEWAIPGNASTEHVRTALPALEGRHEALRITYDLDTRPPGMILAREVEVPLYEVNSDGPDIAHSARGRDGVAERCGSGPSTCRRV